MEYPSGLYGDFGRAEMKTIKVSDTVCFVDDEDYEHLSSFTWRLVTGYAASTDKSIMMHSIIIAVPIRCVVDHIDGNKLNNQRSNLRVATRSQNGANRRMSRNNKSGYKGVHMRYDNKYQVTIVVNAKRICLGTFTNPKLAALCYDEEARKQFGAFAATNFPLS